MSTVHHRTNVFLAWVPHPRFLRVGLRGLTKLGLRQTEQS
jgi:hypothetical protein